MVKKVFSEEQVAMMSECVLLKMREWREISVRVRDDELRELSEKKIGELMTLLNYINA